VRCAYGHGPTKCGKCGLLQLASWLPHSNDRYLLLPSEIAGRAGADGGEWIGSRKRAEETLLAEIEACWLSGKLRLPRVEAVHLLASGALTSKANDDA
jgi:hypothetical protein